MGTEVKVQENNVLSHGRISWEDLSISWAVEVPFLKKQKRIATEFHINNNNKKKET